jgi:hypothetical protein
VTRIDGESGRHGEGEKDIIAKCVMCNAKAKAKLRDSDLPALPMVGSRREQVQNDSRWVQNDRGKG